MFQFLLFAVTLCASFGFFYGLFFFFRKRSELYARMVVFGIGCAMLGRLYEILQLQVDGQISSGFHVSMLGLIGSFQFFFTANYGEMNVAVDDGSKRFYI